MPIRNTRRFRVAAFVNVNLLWVKVPREMWRVTKEGWKPLKALRSRRLWEATEVEYEGRILLSKKLEVKDC